MPAPLNYTAPNRLVIAGGETVDLRDTTIYANTGSGAFTIFMPLVPLYGERHVFKDSKPSWSAQPLTIDGNGYTIERFNSAFVFDPTVTLTKDGIAIEYEFSPDQIWRIISVYLP